MHTETCPECSKTFTKPTIWRARLALRAHQYRGHTYWKKKNETAAAVAEPDAAAINGEHKPRKYQKRATADIQINYCPCCGFDMRKAAIAMAVVMKRG